MTRILGAVLGGTLLLYAAMVAVVERHYATHLPHYDSIGSYVQMWQLADRVHDPAWGIGGILSNGLGPTSWLIPLWGILTAWVPYRSPAVLVSLNVACLLVAQASIVTWGRTHSLSGRRIVVLAFLPLIPGMMSGWDGGIQDLRRDPQLVLLLTALLFLSLAYVEGPNVLRGLCLGAIVGLCQWSRDNAAPMILLVGLPAAIAAVRCRGIRGLFVAAAWPLLTAVPMLGVYYWVAGEQIAWRYLNTVWGVGYDRWGSLLAWWAAPWHVLLGDAVPYARTSPEGGQVTLALLVGLAATLLVGVATRNVVRRHGLSSSLTLLLSGAWVILAVTLYTTLGIGYGPQFNAVPFLPISVGWTAILAGLLGLVRWRGSDRTGALVAGTIALGILAATILRMELNNWAPEGAAEVMAVRDAAILISETAGPDGAVAILSVELSKHHLNYYLHQQRRRPLADYVLREPDRAERLAIDPERRPIAGEQPDITRERWASALERYADVAVVSTEPDAYNRTPLRPDAEPWMHLWGQPVVDRLVAEWRERGRFTVAGREYAVLGNPDR